MEIKIDINMENFSNKELVEIIKSAADQLQTNDLAAIKHEHKLEKMNAAVGANEQAKPAMWNEKKSISPKIKAFLKENYSKYRKSELIKLAKKEGIELTTNQLTYKASKLGLHYAKRSSYSTLRQYPYKKNPLAKGNNGIIAAPAEEV